MDLTEEQKKRIQELKSQGVSDEEINQVLQARSSMAKPTQTQQPTQTKTPVLTVQDATQPTQKDGFIQGIARSLVKPAVDYGKMVGGAGYEGQRAIRSAAGGKNLYIDEQGNEIQNPFMTREETDKFSTVGGAAKEGAKRTAGMMSYFVPAGKGIRGAAATGAATGGLYGFSQGKGEDLEGMAVDAATGAITGAATGAVVAGAGKMLKGARGAGDAARKNVVKPQVKADPFMIEDEKKIMETLGKHGLKGSAASQKGQMPKVFRSISANIKKKLSTSKGSINTADVTRIVDDALDNNINFDESIPMMDKAKNKYIQQIVNMANKGKKDGLTIKPDQLFSLKQNLGKQLKRAFKKLDLGNPLTEKEEVAMTVWSTLDDMITKAEPSVKSMTRAQSYLYKAMPGISKQAEGKIGTPILRYIPGIGRAGQAATDATGRALQKAGDIGQAIPKAVGTGAIKAGTMLGTNAAVGGGDTQGISPEEAIQTDQTTSQESDVQYTSPDGQWYQSTDGNVYSADKQWMWDGAQEDWAPNPNYASEGAAGGTQNPEAPMSLEQYNQQLSALAQSNSTSAVRQYGLLEKERDYYYPAEKAGAGGTSGAALNVLGELRGLYESVQGQGLTASKPGMGRIAGSIKGNTAAISQSSPEAANYRDTMAAFSTLISRGLGEKGVLTDYDVKRAIDALPKFSDTPEKAAQGWAIIEEVLKKAEKNEAAMTGDEALSVMNAVGY